MNTETKTTPEIRYTLDVRIPKKLPQRMDVVDAINLGSDPRNDIIIDSEDGSATKQFTFRMRANALIGINLSGNDKKISLNQMPMMEGKHYILEKGDSIFLNEIEIIIRQDSTGQLAKGFDASNPKLQFLDATKKEGSGSQKIKKQGTSSIKIEEVTKAPVEKKQGFMDKLKSFFQKSPKKAPTSEKKNKKPKK